MDVNILSHVKLINVYHKIQANNKGIVYTDSMEIQNRNRTIVAHSKNENIAGLQLADFVAYNIIKLEGCKVEQQITDFMKQIHRVSYNGGHSISEKDQRSFWGMRVLPSYLRMEKLISSNKSLKNALFLLGAVSFFAVCPKPFKSGDDSI